MLNSEVGVAKGELHGGRARISITSVDDQLLNNVACGIKKQTVKKSSDKNFINKHYNHRSEQESQVNSKRIDDNDSATSHHGSSTGISSNQDEGNWSLGTPLRSLLGKVVKAVTRISSGYQANTIAANINGLDDSQCGENYRKSSSGSTSSSKSKNQSSVSSLTHGKVPGVSGLRNHGNTCFMNAIVQCLCNTDSLAKYFVLGEYKMDVKRRKKSKNLTTNGELTEQIAVLLKGMWTCRYDAQMSSDFKAVVGKYCSQYRGSNQHDAQEFLLWLLDKIHEDLNRAVKSKYKATKDSVGRPVEAVAAEVLANYCRCNDSFVLDTFQAYLRSSLTCPSCNQQSNTFDPFLCVSLPLLQRDTRFVSATVVYYDLLKQCCRFGVDISPDETVDSLCKIFSQQTNIKPELMLVASVDYYGIRRLLSSKDLVMDISSNDTCYIMELPNCIDDATETADRANIAPKATEETYQEVNNSETIAIVIINRRGSGYTATRFGRPVAFRCHRNISYEDLAKAILRKISETLTERINYEYSNDNPPFALRLVNATKDLGLLNQTDEYPLQNQIIDRALSVCKNCPSHIELMIEWDAEMKDKIIGCVIEEKPIEDITVAEKGNFPSSITLYDCLKIYTKEEKLCEDSEWNCSACHKVQRGITKTLSMWTLPEVMIVHLKRFKQIGAHFTKLHDIVSFPIVGLDMSDFIGRPDSDDMHSYGSYRNQRDFRHQSSIYDLYAVCNHHGNMGSGHYTACCRNPSNGRWYSFDDARVEEVSSDFIVTNDAYILFYAQRTVGANLLYDYFGTSTFSHWTEKVISFCVESSEDSDNNETISKSELIESSLVKTWNGAVDANNILSTANEVPKSEANVNEMVNVKSSDDFRKIEQPKDYTSPNSAESCGIDSVSDSYTISKCKVVAETVV
ncbi:Ubiquitin carboxyl-terminal hydrolase 43 [Trichoplax sp. H2]|nr:Ubiquitin carboxyl-terminal hydrolase 43 [Trichoplax sp. H2]|eukprot:RDD43932.1 Ubiquitin carboxyl-terminal hydrolase 43 [Trichoplax sp. H2]